MTGFRRTHRDAADTAKVALASRRRAGSVIPFHAVELAALLAGDPERTRRFVHERLGALARDDDESGRLRATLMLYLEENAQPRRDRPADRRAPEHGREPHPRPAATCSGATSARTRCRCSSRSPWRRRSAPRCLRSLSDD